MNNKFQINQRVSTPEGSGTITKLPIPEVSTTYWVWLDKPYYPSEDAELTYTLVVNEKEIKAL